MYGSGKGEERGASLEARRGEVGVQTREWAA